MGRLISCARLRNSRSTGCPEAPVGVGTGDQALRVSWVIGAYAVSPRVAHERAPTAAVDFRPLRWEFGPIRWGEVRRAPSQSDRP